MPDFSYIVGPRECHAVRTAAEYHALQRDVLRRFVAQGLAPGALAPHPSTTYPAPYVSTGRWVLDCPCGNAPSVSVAWNLALCLECGAVYTGLTFLADRERIEALLLKRRRQHRNWKPPETVADLIRQNLVAGDPIPEEEVQ
jgi:hypothetical protein